MIKLVIGSLIALSMVGCANIDLNKGKDGKGVATQKSAFALAIENAKQTQTPVQPLPPVKPVVAPSVINNSGSIGLNAMVPTNKPEVRSGKITALGIFKMQYKGKLTQMAELTVTSDKNERTVVRLPNSGFKKGQDVMITSEPGKDIQVDIM